MARRTRSTHQKQKQGQVQKVIVNVGEIKRKKSKRRRRPRQPSQEAREYAESISQIIPRIQYNFPSHSSFNYDAYKTPNVVPQGRPTETKNPIPLEAPRTLNEQHNLADEAIRDRESFTSRTRFYDSGFINRKPEPEELPIEKPKPSATYREAPINHPDKIPSMVEGFNEFASNERSNEPLHMQISSSKKTDHEKLYEKFFGVEETPKSQEPEKKKEKGMAKGFSVPRAPYMPRQKAIDEELVGRGLPVTPLNREMIRDEYRYSSKSADQLRRERQQRLKDVPIMETVSQPAVSLAKAESRPAAAPIMEGVAAFEEPPVQKKEKKKRERKSKSAVDDGK